MKKNLFLSVAAAVVGTAVTAAMVAHKQGKLKPAVDKARTGATNMLDKARSSTFVAKATDKFSALRDHFTGSNDNNRPFIDGEAEDSVMQPAPQSTADNTAAEPAAEAA